MNLHDVHSHLKLNNFQDSRICYVHTIGRTLLLNIVQNVSQIDEPVLLCFEMFENGVHIQLTQRFPTL